MYIHIYICTYVHIYSTIHTNILRPAMQHGDGSSYLLLPVPSALKTGMEAVCTLANGHIVEVRADARPLNRNLKRRSLAATMELGANNNTSKAFGSEFPMALRLYTLAGTLGLRAVWQKGPRPKTWTSAATQHGSPQKLQGTFLGFANLKAQNSPKALYKMVFKPNKA